MSEQERTVTVCDWCDETINGDSDKCEWCEGQDFCDGGDCWAEHRGDDHAYCNACGEYFRNYDEMKEIDGLSYCAGCAKEKETEIDEFGIEIETDNLNIITSLAAGKSDGSTGDSPVEGR